MSEYKIPSPTKTVCVTETELTALQFPAPKKVSPKKWNPIPGENLLPIEKLGNEYFISDHGRLLHQTQKKNGRLTQTEIRGSIENGRRFALITNSPSGKIKIKFERTLLECFRPIKRSNYFQAVPLDGDPLNLKLDNWAWMSRIEASRYKKESGQSRAKLKTQVVEGRYGQTIKRTVYSDKEIAEMERLLNAGISVAKIAEIFESQQSYISYVKKNLAKKQKGK